MRVAILSLLLALGVIVAPALAQSSLRDDQKAVLVFDVRMDMLSSSPLGQQMKLSDMLSEAQKKSGQGGADPAKLVRIFGAVSAPKSMAELGAMEPGGDIPFEFFVRAKYQDAEAATEAFDHTLEDSAEKIERNGRTFFKATEGGGLPAGTLMHKIDDTTLEMGTEAYVFHDDRKVFTDNLKVAWSKAPNEAIRMSMDIEGAQALVKELIAEGKKNAPDPTFEAFYDLIDNVSHMGISVDLTGTNLLSVRATALDTEQGEELKGGLDSLLFMAQTGGKGVLPMLGEMAPDVKPVAESILDSLVAKIDGTDVSIVIPKPDGFEGAVQTLGQIVPMMLMGGPGMGEPGMGEPGMGEPGGSESRPGPGGLDGSGARPGPGGVDGSGSRPEAGGLDGSGSR